MITAINTWAVSMVRYTAPLVDWRMDELKEIDRDTRKMMNMYRVLHPRDSVARLYLPRKNGGRGLVAIEDCVEIAILGLRNYVQDSKEMILSSARCEARQRATKIDFKKQRREERQAELGGKALHGQTQSLRTNTIKANIDKTQEDSKCRMCKQKEQTVSHIVSECPKLAQREYKRRHDCVAKALHWDLCRLYDMDCGNKWYEHQPDGVLDTSDVKILWDFTSKQTKLNPGKDT